MSHDAGQLRPGQVCDAQFNRDHAKFLDVLATQGLDVELYASAFNPYPFVITDQQLSDLVALQRSIQKAVVAVVTNFTTDERIRAVIKLSDAELSVIDKYKGLPYRNGGIRPDFLFAADGRAMITEINGRFPINGFLSSVLLSRSIQQLDLPIRALPDLDKLEQGLTTRLGDAKKLGIIKASEPGWDINLLQSYLKNQSRMFAPKTINAEGVNDLGCVVLELHQDELVSGLDQSVRNAIINHPNVLNDLRTILIAHDKRLLALLSTSDVLQDYLSADDCVRLKKHIIPTWTKAQAPEKFAEAAAKPNGWLAKPPRSGKGAGIIVSDQVSAEEWRRALAEMTEDWILQPYIEQQLFDITTLEDGKVTTKPMKVVGLLPTIDDQVYGPGMFRAAADDIVNVARGGTILAPALRGSAPVLEKADLHKLLDTKSHGANVYYSRSTGSTAHAVYFPTDAKENHHQRALLAAHFRAHTVFTSNDVVMNIFPSGRMYRPLEIFTEFAELCEATNLPMSADATDQEIYEQSERFSADTLMGMPSRILAFARYAADNNLALRFKKIIFGGEFLQVGKREFLSSVFGTETFCGVYGSAELGIVAFNADMKDRTTYQVANDILHVEILNPDAEGYGALVCTNLVRKRFPVIRYNTGDVARVLSSDAATTTIELKGRKADSFLIGDDYFTVEDFAEVTRGLAGFQIQIYFDEKQKSDVLKFLLVEGVTANRDALEKRIQAIVDSHDAMFKTDVVFVGTAQLQKSASGTKTPTIIDRRGS